MKLKSAFIYSRLFKIKDDVLNSINEFLDYYKSVSDKPYLVNQYYNKVLKIKDDKQIPHLSRSAILLEYHTSQNQQQAYKY